jgi:hypothetical protein
VPQPGGRQVEARLTVRKRADHPGLAPDLAYQQLERVIGSDPPPVFFWEGIVGEGLAERIVDTVGSTPLSLHNDAIEVNV